MYSLTLRKGQIIHVRQLGMFYVIIRGKILDSQICIRITIHSFIQPSLCAPNMRICMAMCGCLEGRKTRVSNSNLSCNDDKRKRAVGNWQGINTTRENDWKPFMTTCATNTSGNLLLASTLSLHSHGARYLESKQESFCSYRMIARAQLKLFSRLK